MAEGRDECLRFGCDDDLARPIDWAKPIALITSFANLAPAAPRPWDPAELPIGKPAKRRSGHPNHSRPARGRIESKAEDTKMDATMEPDEPPATIPPEIMADLEEVCRHVMTGGVRDPELLRRIRARSEAVRKELWEKYGELDIAVDLIREAREEE